MRWATAPSNIACVIDAIGSAGLQSQACNEFPRKFVTHFEHRT
jgi:hypothetical protein